MTSFYNVCRAELTELLQKNGFESYRSEQLFKLIYQNSMQERYIPQKLSTFLKDNFGTGPVGRIEKENVSMVDGTRKVLIELESPKYKVESKFGNCLWVFSLFVFSCFDMRSE